MRLAEQQAQDPVPVRPVADRLDLLLTGPHRDELNQVLTLLSNHAQGAHKLRLRGWWPLR
jgi:hypothetical protein